MSIFPIKSVCFILTYLLDRSLESTVLVQKMWSIISTASSPVVVALALLLNKQTYTCHLCLAFLPMGWSPLYQVVCSKLWMSLAVSIIICFMMNNNVSWISFLEHYNTTTLKLSQSLLDLCQSSTITCQ